MLDLIEKAIRDCGYLHIEQATFGSDILVGIDFPCTCGLNNATDVTDATIVYKGTEIKDSIDDMCCMDDLFAISVENFLLDFSNKEPAFLFARGKSLELALNNLANRLEMWYQMNIEQRKELLLSFSEAKQMFSVDIETNGIG